MIRLRRIDTDARTGPGVIGRHIHVYVFVSRRRSTQFFVNIERRVPYCEGVAVFGEI
jgi:hypothetical protein